MLHHQPGRSMGKTNALSQQADHGLGTEDNNNLTLVRPELFAIQALEGLTTIGEERDILQDIQKAL